MSAPIKKSFVCLQCKVLVQGQNARPDNGFFYWSNVKPHTAASYPRFWAVMAQLVLVQVLCSGKGGAVFFFAPGQNAKYMYNQSQTAERTSAQAQPQTAETIINSLLQMDSPENIRENLNKIMFAYLLHEGDGNNQKHAVYDSFCHVQSLLINIQNFTTSNN